MAEQGIAGEKISAQNKLARLRARFDFSVPDPAATPDLFSGNFKRSTRARRIYSFSGNEFDVANSVKWAIESAAKIPCVYRDSEFLAEVTPGTARRLTEIAAHIAHSFRALLHKFSAVDGVSVTDRSVFIRGLYDGMMNEERDVGQGLPSRSQLAKKVKAKKRPVICAHLTFFRILSVLSLTRCFSWVSRDHLATVKRFNGFEHRRPSTVRKM